MKTNDLMITYHLNTFNRLKYLKNLFLSFEKCNVLENFEWIITDYGSSDGTRDYLYDMTKNDERVNIIFNNEKLYLKKLEKINRKPQSRHQFIAAIFGKSINEARAIANGDYYIHVADDHQFIRRGNWLKDMLDVLDHRYQKVGKEDISSILYRGQLLYRLYKQNNETFPEEKTNTGISYFVAKHKHYDDYHLMKRETFQKLGPCFEIHKEEREDILNMWHANKKVFNHYIDYLDRTKSAGYSKVFLKMPYAVDLDGHASSITGKKLAIPIIEDSIVLGEACDKLTRPMSSNEIINIARSLAE